MTAHKMVDIGKLNRLKVIRRATFGLYLDGQALGEILMPTRYVPAKSEVGDTLEVFVCYDSDDRLIATTEKPLGMVGEVAVLRVAAVESVGAFLHWGLPKDLFLPFAEQTHPPRVGHDLVAYIYLDNSQRISASMRLARHMEKTQGDFKEGQSVNLLITTKTDLGYKAVIERRYWGMLYANEIFQPLQYGQPIKGYIRKMRDDGKIDLSLQKTGHKAGDEIAIKIMDLLREKKGFLAINDKTPAETIYNLFGSSKKKYKIALGGLYKRRLITIEKDGIRSTTK